jgi:hypothetical protein
MHIAGGIRAQEAVLDTLFSKFSTLQEELFSRQLDSAYITSYRSEPAIRLVAVNKGNLFNVRDAIRSSNLLYRPDARVNLGVGVSYKWFSIDLAFNFGLGETTEFVNRDFLDFQANIFSARQYMSATLQYYYGYNLAGYGGTRLSTGNYGGQRDDIRTIKLGLQYIYAFNYDRFSFRAPFVLNEKQKKSAGSWLVGAQFMFYTMDADSAVVPAAASADFSPQVQLTGLNALSLMLGAGYAYSFVWKKHFFLTLGIMPGVAISKGDYQRTYRQPYRIHVPLVINSMNAIGYNGRRFFAGLHFIGEGTSVRIDKKLRVYLGHGKTKFFVGYRFGKKKE